MPAHAVRQGSTPHELGQGAICGRPNYQMKVIRHHAVSEDIDGNAPLCFRKSLQPQVIVELVFEKAESAYTPVDHVKRQSRSSLSEASWHLARYYKILASGKEIGTLFFEKSPDLFSVLFSAPLSGPQFSSHRSVSAGSTRAARRAGSQAAKRTMTVSVAATVV
jgi:hypothetical protein